MVLGAPRSGTSLLAGMLVDAGFDPGPDLIPPSEHNPRGFFESLRVNRLNDDLLEPAVATRSVPGAMVPPRAQWWLAAIDGPLAGPVPESVRGAMAGSLGAAPSVVKDPRMGYTLPLWDPVLAGAEVVCVLRQPAEVVASVVAMIEREPASFADFRPTVEHLFTFWVSLHRSIEAIADRRKVAWFHFDDLVHGDGADRLGDHLGLAVPSGRRERTLHRSRSGDLDVPAHVRLLHDRLRERCGGG